MNPLFLNNLSKKKNNLLYPNNYTWHEKVGLIK